MHVEGVVARHHGLIPRVELELHTLGPQLGHLLAQ